MADSGFGNVEQPLGGEPPGPPAGIEPAAARRTQPQRFSIWRMLRSGLLHNVKTGLIAVFCRQLSILIDVGVPLLQALRKVKEQTTDPHFRQIIHTVGEEIELGGNFSDALSNHPKVFSSLFISIIKVAERGGVLDESLKLLADELEKREEIRSKIRRALDRVADFSRIEDGEK